MKHLRSRLHLGALTTLAIGALAAPAVVVAQDSTSTLHYKGVSISPIGFAAAEFVWRQKNEEADIGSSYNAIPFSGTSAGNTSEFRMTGRQSRIGLLAAGSADDMKFSGYWEADFLGVGTTSNSTESNSYVLRIRQYFAQIGFNNGTTLDAGQMWSFVTTDKSGLLPRSEQVPLTIEAQYAAGFNWARQAAFRATTKLGDEASAGIAVEGAQTTIGGRNIFGNILLGQTGGSLLNGTANYSADFAPDIIAKLAFDPKGLGHWEIKGLTSFFRDRVVDPATPATTRNMNSTGYGVGIGTFYPVMAGGRDVMDIGVSGLYGKGIGRYGTSGLPDVTIAVDSSLAPIKEAQGLLSIETHPTKMLDVYGYAGAEYADRTAFLVGAKGVGYGSAAGSNATGCGTEAAPGGQYAPASGTCNVDTRAIWQGNLGFWYRFYKGAGGTVQWGMQYSYTSRNTWSDATGLQPQAIENMLFSSFRYVLP